MFFVYKLQAVYMQEWSRLLLCGGSIGSHEQSHRSRRRTLAVGAIIGLGRFFMVLPLTTFDSQFVGLFIN